MKSSSEIYAILYGLDLLRETEDPYWWPNSGTFEVIVGAVLTQQTKWQKVEKSLINLKNADLLTLDALANVDHKMLSDLIKPSGFYNTKSKWLKELAKAIKERYGNFETFCEQVDRDWLLAQKGVGEETADAILCYACRREVLVVDAYTNRLLSDLGYTFDTYSQIQEWMMQDIESNVEKLVQLDKKHASLFTIYSLFHGMILEFQKQKLNVEEVFNDSKQ